jgi:dihydroorotate dehydrogenase (NAD+) catalytic subunit
MNVEMSVEVGGLRLRSPVLAASGTFGYGTEVPLLDRSRLGAVLSKGVTLRPRAGTAPPRIVETPSGMLNAIGLQNPGVEAVVAAYAPLWATWDHPVLVNVNGESVEDYVAVAAALDGVPGISGLELNISCPNVDAGGMWFGNDPRAAALVTGAVRRRTRLPLWVKLTPNVADIGVIARAVEDAGADAITAVNTFVGMSIDLRTLEPRLANWTGGLSGPAIRPAALHLAHQAARAVSIPVVGIGGIASAEDALEFLVAGCAAVQVGTATFVEPRTIANVYDGIAAFLTARGLAELSELPRCLPAAGSAAPAGSLSGSATR